MSAITANASLSALPAELLREIIAILTAQFLVDEKVEYLRALRALSQTNQVLRELAMPPAWGAIDVHTVAELGRLRELFRASPSLARHVRVFGFEWNMDGDYDCEEIEDLSKSTQLDRAFCNRLEMWEHQRQQKGAQAQVSPRGIFFDDVTSGQLRFAPGRPQVAQGSRRKFGLDEDPCAPRERGSGPDGTGEDEHVKSASIFRECMSEVVAKMTSLRAFKYETPVTPMPTGAFDALRNLAQPLNALYLSLPCFRDNSHDLPVWELSSQLRSLSLTCEPRRDPDVIGEDVQEQFEEQLSHVEIPATLPFETFEASTDFHEAIACRTVIAAARGGRLRRLIFDFPSNRPFAVRSMLPFWVHVNDWSEYDDAASWHSAASTLRRVLSHVSLWLDTTSTEPRNDRHLAPQHIQSLQSYFPQGVPRFCRNTDFDEPQPVERYFPWLQDAELAQQVSDAWNAVVERGDADILSCTCSRCHFLAGPALL